MDRPVSKRRTALRMIRGRGVSSTPGTPAALQRGPQSQFTQLALQGDGYAFGAPSVADRANRIQKRSTGVPATLRPIGVHRPGDEAPAALASLRRPSGVSGIEAYREAQEPQPRALAGLKADFPGTDANDLKLVPGVPNMTVHSGSYPLTSGTPNGLRHVYRTSPVDVAMGGGDGPVQANVSNPSERPEALAYIERALRRRAADAGATEDELAEADTPEALVALRQSQNRQPVDRRAMFMQRAAASGGPYGARAASNWLHEAADRAAKRMGTDSSESESRSPKSRAEAVEAMRAAAPEMFDDMTNGGQVGSMEEMLDLAVAQGYMDADGDWTDAVPTRFRQAWAEAVARMSPTDQVNVQKKLEAMRKAAIRGRALKPFDPRPWVEQEQRSSEIDDILNYGL